ncbi:MAG: polysaccharide deacetylase family protein [Candidatus Limivicinus sp.]|jgi:peptidoglycan/xylan/chitin deacetylase (PgdA/CDA1 family)
MSKKLKNKEKSKDKNKEKNSQARAALIAAVAAACTFLLLGLLLYFAPFGSDVRFYLKGGAEIDTEYGEPYVEPGARATAVSGITHIKSPLFVKSEGVVDTGKIGSYHVRYYANHGLKDYEAERTVNVVDTTPPEIKLLSREGYSPSWYEGYEEEGYTAEDSRDGDLTDKVEVSRGRDSVIYTVTDSAGNTGMAERRVDYGVAPPEISLNGDADITINARPYFEDPGVTAVDSEGSDLSGYVQVESSLDSTRPGEYKILYFITNALGETVSAERRVTVAGQDCPETVIPEGRTIYLTFDDGPGPYTEQLLDILKEYGAKATFFVTGNRAGNRASITRAFNEGHSIGVHTYTHDYGTVYASEESFYQDFNATEEMIRELTGSYTQLYRFPGGSSNTVSRFNPGIVSRLSAQLEAMGYRYFDWNVCSGDAGETTNTDTVISNIIGPCSKKNCAVVLQHDIKGFSVDAVESVLRWGKDNGYSFRALDLSSPGMHHSIAN